MTKKVNKISELNLLYDIINPPKRTKILNIHYYPIIHGCMNTRKGKANFNNILILFDSGFSSPIVRRGGAILKSYILKNIL